MRMSVKSRAKDVIEFTKSSIPHFSPAFFTRSIQNAENAEKKEDSRVWARYQPCTKRTYMS